MKINPKNLIKKNPFILAPMDDVTDIAFRKLCEKHKASYSTTELTSVDALIHNKVYKSRYERSNLKINSIQLFGKDPLKFVEAAKNIETEADMIDVNLGCPSPTVTKNDAGSMLLKDPKNVSQIIEKLVKNINLPITAKIRLGYEKTNHIQIAKEIEDSGASLITVHGRTAKQKYSGKANFNAIQEIYETLKIPVIGNGDIKEEEQIDIYLSSQNPHCDALMIGRAAIGNPFIFERFNHYYKTGEKLEISDIKNKQKELFLEYLKLLENHKFHNKALKIQRQAMWFMKGLENVSKLRYNISQTKEIDKIIEIVKKF